MQIATEKKSKRTQLLAYLRRRREERNSNFEELQLSIAIKYHKAALWAEGKPQWKDLPTKDIAECHEVAAINYFYAADTYASIERKEESELAYRSFEIHIRKFEELSIGSKE